MIRENATTRLNVISRSTGATDPFLQAVQEAAAGDFTVLGEIGRGADGVIIYLAREASSQRLVALRLQREGQLADEYGLELVRHLDNSMPAPASKCVKCGESVTGWARFCSQCGSDLTGAAPASADPTERAMMLHAVREAVAGQYEVLGEMSRTEGGGAAYFARDSATGAIVALRLQREGVGDEFSLGLTTALKPIARSLGVRSGVTQTVAPLPPPPPRPAPPAAAPPAARKPGAPPPPPPTATGRNPALKFVVGGAALVAVVAAIVLLTLPRTGSDLPVPAPEPVAAATDTTTVDSPQLTVDGQPAEPDTPVNPGASARAAQPPSRPAALATVRLGALPSGAVLRVDGRVQRGSGIRVTPGAHRLSLTAPGYESREETLTLRAGETAQWSPTLARAAPPPAPRPPKPVASACATDVKSEDWSAAFTACFSEAQAGGTVAKRHLAMLYEHGRGIKRSEKSAAIWYEAAAKDGDAAAMYSIARAYERGDGVDDDDAQALSWYTKAANDGVVEAQSRLGEVYKNGDLGVEKNKQTALKWYQKAAAQGDKNAADKADDLAKDLEK